MKELLFYDSVLRFDVFLVLTHRQFHKSVLNCLLYNLLACVHHLHKPESR